MAYTSLWQLSYINNRTKTPTMTNSRNSSFSSSSATRMISNYNSSFQVWRFNDNFLIVQWTSSVLLATLLQYSFKHVFIVTNICIENFCIHVILETSLINNLAIKFQYNRRRLSKIQVFDAWILTGRSHNGLYKSFIMLNKFFFVLENIYW